MDWWLFSSQHLHFESKKESSLRINRRWAYLVPHSTSWHLLWQYETITLQHIHNKTLPWKIYLNCKCEEVLVCSVAASGWYNVQSFWSAYLLFTWAHLIQGPHCDSLHWEPISWNRCDRNMRQFTAACVGFVDSNEKCVEKCNKPNN